MVNPELGAGIKDQASCLEEYKSGDKYGNCRYTYQYPCPDLASNIKPKVTIVAFNNQDV